MNAVFNQVDFIHRLEAAGLARDAAGVIASEIEERNREVATRFDLEQTRLTLEHSIGATRIEIERTRTDLERTIEHAITRQTLQFGAMLTVGHGLATAIIGTVIALH